MKPLPPLRTNTRKIIWISKIWNSFEISIKHRAPFTNNFDEIDETTQRSSDELRVDLTWLTNQIKLLLTKNSCEFPNCVKQPTLPHISAIRQWWRSSPAHISKVRSEMTGKRKKKGKKCFSWLNFVLLLISWNLFDYRESDSHKGTNTLCECTEFFIFLFSRHSP